jgi:hypothetical protein
VVEPAISMPNTASDESTVSAIARKTRTPIEVVKHLYDEEFAELKSNSAVKNFLEVIAGRRVKERLRRTDLPRSKLPEQVPVRQ